MILENQIGELKGKKCEKANKQKSFYRRQVSECSGILLLRCRTYKEAKKTSFVGNIGCYRMHVQFWLQARFEEGALVGKEVVVSVEPGL